MYPVSDRFLATLVESHSPIVLVQLFGTDGSVTALDVTGGSVSVDRANTVRRTCSVTITDLDTIPRTAKAQLNTSGAQLRISRGIAYSDGTTELVPLGLFRLDSIGGDVDTGPVTLQGKAWKRCFRQTSS